MDEQGKMWEQIAAAISQWDDGLITRDEALAKVIASLKTDQEKDQFLGWIGEQMG